MNELDLCFTLELAEGLAFANPFVNQRTLLEQKVIDHFGQTKKRNPRFVKIDKHFDQVLYWFSRAEDSLLAGSSEILKSDKWSKRKSALAYFCLFHEMLPELDSLCFGRESSGARTRSVFRFLEKGIQKRKKIIENDANSLWKSPAHLFACFYQLRRSYLYVSSGIRGQSRPIQDLRSRVWQSIFTRDMLSYQQWMHEVVGRFPTIILGPSGSGKEVVADAIARSRFIPYDEKKGEFSAKPDLVFHPVHLSSLSETLLESELFGHKEGSFTGAIRDHKGVFQTAGKHGSVFLDEIGEVPEAVQVKLLRILQSGEFQPIGAEQKSFFQGKVIAATHRNLNERMHSGKMREDFFYRLCGDQIKTVSLREILDDSPKEMNVFISFISQKLFGKKGGEELRPRISTVLADSLPEDYPWPGNFRELEQAVRNVVVTGQYHPPKSLSQNQGISNDYEHSTLSMDQWISIYANQAYENFGSYREAAKRIGVDQRTLKKWVLEERGSTSYSGK
ncbi:MAG: sigma 54-interacting transcriptional regulator [Opitutales bacterium]|nr:sigma 54-interacting transcriptional regulator [Opitutales bacterium]